MIYSITSCEVVSSTAIQVEILFTNFSLGRVGIPPAPGLNRAAESVPILYRSTLLQRKIIAQIIDVDREKI